MPITLPDNFKLDYQTVAFIKHLMAGKVANIKYGIQMLSEAFKVRRLFFLLNTCYRIKSMINTGVINENFSSKQH
jgi:hypothetical protein